jgi:membrane protein YqaA with SNARE-associated domain
MTWSARLYSRFVASAHRPYMVWVLGASGFISASIAPLPLDPLFVLLSLQQPKRIPYFVLSGVVGVTLGGGLMYGIGYVFYHTFAENFVTKYGLTREFYFLQKQIGDWGGWILIIKAFTPFPYKVLSLICGMTSFNFWIFVGASLLGRALRFGLEGIILKFYGPHILEVARKHRVLSALLFLFLMLFGIFFLKII